LKKYWWVYIAKCSNRALYTGITNDLKKRLATHNAGKGGKYTRSHLPIRFIFTKRVRGKSAALKLEIKIKSFKTQKKREFIASCGQTGSRRPPRIAETQSLKKRKTHHI